MGLMMLAAAQGCAIVIETEGAQSKDVLEALISMIEDNFGEEE